VIKIVGILLLMAVCSAYGFYRANMLFCRKNRLKALCLFIEAAENKIRLGSEMQQIVLTEGAAAGIYLENLNFLIKKENLTPSDIALAEDFLGSLGMGDMVGELKRCQTYKSLIEKEYINAEQEAKQKAALYQKLGVFLGLLVGIVMI